MKAAKEALTAGPELRPEKLTQRDMDLLEKKDYDRFWFRQIDVDGNDDFERQRAVMAT